MSYYPLITIRPKYSLKETYSINKYSLKNLQNKYYIDKEILNLFMKNTFNQLEEKQFGYIGYRKLPCSSYYYIRNHKSYIKIRSLILGLSLKTKISNLFYYLDVLVQKLCISICIFVQENQILFCLFLLGRLSMQKFKNILVIKNLYELKICFAKCFAKINTFSENIKVYSQLEYWRMASMGLFTGL